MIKKPVLFLLLAVVIANLCCCSDSPAAAEDPTVIAGYGTPRKVDNVYAECFTIYEYDNGDAMITTNDGKAYLITDSKPSGLAANVTVIPHSPDLIYMAGSAVMCFKMLWTGFLTYVFRQ